MSAGDDVSLVPLGGLVVEEGADTGLVVAIGERPVTVGRETGCEIRLTDTSSSRRHFRVLPGPDGRPMLEDMGSANGTFVNGERTAKVALQADDRIKIGETTIRFVSEAELLELLRRRTMRVTDLDPLTQTSTRRMFDMRLRTEVALSARSGGVVSFAILAVDRLEELRKQLGERAADRILQAVALALGGYLTENDLVARFDDNSFVILILNPSPNVAYLMVERMCAGVEGLTVDVGGQSVSVTASVGVASEKGRRDLTVESLTDRARGEVDRAREAGGACVSRWVHPNVREPIPAVSGDLRGTVVDLSRKGR